MGATGAQAVDRRAGVPRGGGVDPYLGVSEQTFERWKRTFAGIGVAELRRLRQVENENGRLKQLVADLKLDKQILQETRRTDW